MTAVEVRVSPEWLRLREPADVAARSTRLVRALSAAVGAGAPWVVHDLGCGTGSMVRWVAPQLRGPQHWVLHDRDPDLLRIAAADPPPAAADGAAVTVQTRAGDLFRLGSGALARASLVTASALLDMFTDDEVEAFVRTCVSAACPALVVLSVTGHVRITPSDPLDPELQRAFNEHQCRTVGGRTLLGPAAVGAAVGRFRARGWQVEVARSPWRLGAPDTDLVHEWLRGWVGAACEQRPGLEPVGAAYLAQRARDLELGRLAVEVEHLDLLALPPGGGR